MLVHRDRVVCECEVARERSARRRGLLGRDGLDGALALPGVRSVHTFGMRFAIDAAFVARDGEVLRIVTLPPGRVSRVVWRAASTIEAAAGAFAAWGVGAGDRIEVR